MSALPDEQAIEDAAAGERIARFLAIIRSAETEASLDWIDNVPRSTHISEDVRAAAASASVKVALQRRRAEIRNRPATLF